MHRFPGLTPVLLAIALVAAPASARAGQMIDVSEGARVQIEFNQFFENAPPSGWIPVDVRIINRAPTERTWGVRFTCEAGVGENLLGEWTLPVAGEATREFSLLVPQPWFAGGAGYMDVRATFSGPGVTNGIAVLDRGYRGPRQTSFTGMSQLLAAENWSRLEAELSPPATGGSGVHSSSSVDLSGSRLEPAQVPADWRAWSGFATVWLHRDDWIAMSAVQRLAVLRWVTQGGRLYLAGSGSGLTDLPPMADMRVLGNHGGPYWPGCTVGFGTVTRVPLEADPSGAGGARLPIVDVAAIVKTTTDESPALADLDTEITTTGLETELGRVRPGGPLLGVLIAAIAILLGPVNIFVLAPAHRRARLFITVPLISLGGAIALVGLILFQDGTGGRGYRGVLIALSADRPEALVLQEQTALTGLLVDRDFALPEDMTLVDYTDRAGELPFHSGSERAARFGLHRRGATASGDWFTSRTAHAQHLRTFVPTRAGLTLTTAPDGQLSVLSTCPGILHDVVVTDAQDRAWWAASVPPGRSVPLTAADEAVLARWRDQLRRAGVSLAALAPRKPAAGSFYATAESWDESVPVPTLPSIRWKNDAILVTGTCK